VKFMLYSIIPPIIIVLSLIGIIVFLAKKAPQVALLEDSDDIKELSGDEIEKRGFFKRIFRSNGAEGGGLKQGFLAFLEKFTRKLRVLFLKLENLFTRWSENIRKKRKSQTMAESEENKNIPGEISDEGMQNGTNGDIISRVRNYGQKIDVANRNTTQTRKMNLPQDEEERVFRPIISEKVVIPRSKPEIKNRLERILIERIAANPKDTEAYERLGEYYFEIENYQHSKECFKQVVKLDPMNANVKDKMRKLERLLFRR
jgi:hypothetical protein